MIEWLITGFRTLLVQLAYILPGHNVGFALVILSIISFVVLFVFLYFLYTYRILHQIIFHRTHQKNKHSNHLAQVYKELRLHPWRGAELAVGLSLFYVGLLYIVAQVVHMSPSDVSMIAFRKIHLLQAVEYQFMGFNLATIDIPLVVILFPLFFLIMEMLIHALHRVRYMKIDHRIAIDIILIGCLGIGYFALMSSFSFGMLVFFSIQVICSLLYEVFGYHETYTDIHDALVPPNKKSTSKQAKYSLLQDIGTTLRYFLVTSPYIYILIFVWMLEVL